MTKNVDFEMIREGNRLGFFVTKNADFLEIYSIKNRLMYNKRNDSTWGKVW